MPYKLFDFIDHRGNNAVKIWLQGLERMQLSKVNARLKLLEQSGDELIPSIVTPAVGSVHILEIPIGGNVALRLLLCRGPLNLGKDCREFTLLFGARERDRKYVPPNAVQKADERRLLIMKDPSRRCEHEHVGPGTNQ